MADGWEKNDTVLGFFPQFHWLLALPTW
jgi:hypothetical protein